MFGGKIKNRVMKVINQRIETAQKQYDETCADMDKAHEVAKDNLANTHAESILGQIK